MQTAAIWSTILEGRNPGWTLKGRAADDSTIQVPKNWIFGRMGTDFCLYHNIATIAGCLALTNTDVCFQNWPILFLFVSKCSRNTPKKRHTKTILQKWMGESHQMGCPSPRKLSKSVYTLVNQHSWLENGPGLKMMFLLKMEIFHCYCWWKKILHQFISSLRVYLIIYRVSKNIHSGGLGMGFLKHQQYVNVYQRAIPGRFGALWALLFAFASADEGSGYAILQRWNSFKKVVVFVVRFVAISYSLW